MARNIVSYLRVSTDRQGKSGLGLDAQRDAIARFAVAEGLEMCSMNGSQSAPSSVTTNGTFCAIRPEMNATSRLSRSSFATTMALTQHSCRHMQSSGQAS